jgi:GT2 family glycosyltransferase
MPAMVSIIIVSFNSVKYVPACLDSLHCQEYEPFEVIVYDNASTDGTQALIREHYPEVQLIEGKSNIGFAAANNCAADLAKGELLAFLNPDTIVAPNWLLPLIDALESDQTVGAVTPELVLTEAPDTVNACGNEVHLSGITYCRRFGMPTSEETPIEVGAVSGAAFVLRRELFEQLGGFEPSFFLFFEDTDLSLRLRCLGFRCLAVPASRVRHDHKPAFTHDKIFYLERNRYLSLLSLMNSWTFVAMLPSLLLMELAVGGYCIMRGRRTLGAKARAWQDVARRLSWVQERRQQYANKCISHAFLLQAFSPRLRIHYLDTNSNLLLRGLEFAGWITAVPTLSAVRFFNRHE